MAITKRGETWQYDFRHEGKRYRKSGYPTKRDAKYAENEKLNQLTKGVYLDRELSFTEYFEHWSNAHTKSISKQSKDVYKASLKLIKIYFKSKPFTKITRPDYQNFLDWCAIEAPNHQGKNRKGRAKNTMKQINTHVRACVKDAVYDGVITRDFTYKAKINYSVKEKDKDGKFLEYEDFKKLMNHVENDLTLFNLIIYVSGITGGRYSDVINMKVSHVDQLKNQLFLPGTKTDDAPRYVKITNEQMQKIKSFIDSKPRNISGRIFEQKGKVPYNYTLNDHLSTLCDELNIKEVTFHALRHTHCSVLINADISVDYIKERMGHKNVQTTLNTYSHIFKDKQKQEEEKAIETMSVL